MQMEIVLCEHPIAIIAPIALTPIETIKKHFEEIQGDWIPSDI